MRPLDACMCSVDSRRRLDPQPMPLATSCECDIYRIAGPNHSLFCMCSVYFVCHYIPDHEIKRFWSRFSNFQLFWFFTDLVNAPVRITRNFVCIGTFLSDHEMKKILVSCPENGGHFKLFQPLWTRSESLMILYASTLQVYLQNFNFATSLYTVF